MADRIKVLYVDDEADIRNIVEFAFEDEADIELQLCASGYEALQRVTEFHPDLILLDVMMPGLDGPATLQRLRELEYTRSTPVVFATAKAQGSEIEAFKAMGAVDVIAKPFDPMDVVRRVRNLSAQPEAVTPVADQKQDKLLALRAAYRNELPARIDEIRRLGSALTTAHPAQRVLERLHRHVHSISGAASTFGYAGLSRAAQEAEELLAALDTGADALDADIEAQLQEAIGRMEALALAEPDAPPAAPHREAPIAGPPVSRMVYVIEDDVLLAKEIEHQLAPFGWKIRSFKDATQAHQALAEEPDPAAMIADVILPEGQWAGIELLANQRAGGGRKLPCIAISSTWNWESRLMAARAGMDAFLSKPLDFTALIDQLDRFTHRHEHAPYRVLLVEDSVSLAHYYALTLENAGMQVCTVTQPRWLLEALSDFQPELVLMDLYMPECSGIEAARVIRQDPNFLSVPIVFLSSEAQRQRQLGALQSGADDFLVKPIDEAHLIAAVTTRAERFRDLAQVMREDSLTGLLNHNTFENQLENEYSRAERTGTPLAVVMLDIDHFKYVNDSYGHPVGDRVLKSLAKLLGGRLRKSDIVGRYGGEEFAVLLPDTEYQAAFRVINTIREQFEHLVHKCDRSEFTCTFSGGVATVPPAKGAGDLLRAADEALYRAKREGRNRICCLDEQHCQQKVC